LVESADVESKDTQGSLYLPFKRKSMKDSGEIKVYSILTKVQQENGHQILREF
jgi:hypothetical protein